MLGRKVRTFEGLLQDFFIPGEPRSTWLYRLTIVRDDLQFELDSIGIEGDGTIQDFWRLHYFLRRISVSILDACAILRHDVPTWVNTQSSAPKPLRDRINDAAKVANETWRKLETVRNTIGGHVRPHDAPQHAPGVGPEQAPRLDMIERLVSDHDGWAADVAIGEDNFQLTRLHGLSVTSLLAIWPEVKDDASFLAKGEALKETLADALAMILPEIDNLLWLHWSSNPAIKKSDSELDRKSAP